MTGGVDDNLITSVTDISDVLITGVNGACDLMSTVSTTPAISCTVKKEKKNFLIYKENSDGIGCRVIFEEGLPNI
jgi:hypothetical protein